VIAAVARRLGSGALALLVVGGVLAMAVALSPFGAEPPRPPGMMATWRVPVIGDRLTPGPGAEAGQEFIVPTATGDTFTAAVTRTACSGGITGEVYPPDISIEPDRIVVTFEVDLSLGGECPSNDWVAYKVKLGQDIGDRVIVDGWCLVPEHAADFYCGGGAVRWPTRSGSPAEE